MRARERHVFAKARRPLSRYGILHPMYGILHVIYLFAFPPSTSSRRRLGEGTKKRPLHHHKICRWQRDVISTRLPVDLDRYVACIIDTRFAVAANLLSLRHIGVFSSMFTAGLWVAQQQRPAGRSQRSAYYVPKSLLMYLDYSETIRCYNQVSLLGGNYDSSSIYVVLCIVYWCCR